MADLLLSEQLLLIALDDEKGSDQTNYGSDPGLAAGLLLDLARLDLVRIEDEKVLAVDGPDPGHDLLRDAHEAIRADDKPRKPKHWVDKLPGRLGHLRDRLAASLVDRGILGEDRSKLLGLFNRTRYPEADPAPERELKARLTEVLVTGREPSEQEALLIGLLHPLGLVDKVVPKEERKPARKRAKDIGENGIAGDAVRDAVREMQAVIMTTVIVPVIVTTQ